MADQQLNIKLNAIDNASKAFTEIKNSIFNLRNALIGIGVGASIKGILNVGSQAEKLRNQFLLLSPSVDEGKKSFESLQKFIASSPLESDSIERASETIITFSKNSNDLISNLTAIQNASIALGIDIETVSREFSSLSRTGIDGARELKRRNLEQFLGLQTGIKVSSEEIVRLFLKKFGKNGEFESASEAFANTFAGATNRFKNSFKNIQESIAQAGLLDFFADLTNVFTNFVRNNPELLAKIVKDFTLGLIEGIKAFASFSARLVTLIKEPFVLIVDSIKALDDLRKQFPPVVGEIGILGFLLLGTRGKIIAIIIGDFLRRLNDLRRLGNDISKEGEGSLENQNSLLKEEFDLEKLLLQQSQKRLEAQRRIEQTIDSTKGKQVEQLTTLEKIIERFKVLNDEALKNLQNTTEVIAQTLDQILKDVSKGLAEFIVLGKSLGDTFKNAIQNALIRILSTQIEILFRIATQLFFDKLRNIELFKQAGLLLEQLSIEKLITREKEAQARASQSQGGGGGDLFGTLLNIGSSIFGFAEGGAVSAGQPITVGERGRELFIPNTDGTIIPNQDLATGANSYNFTIVATDVRGVKELLLNNRSTIVNIMNQALNAKGKSSLV
jgi:hypothetical protein